MKNFYYTLIFLAFTFYINAQTTPTGSSTEVGVTEGQLSVSLSGSATYSIPIAVPPGINGVVPQVSLVYNSQGGNGMAGYGWNISGVSAITRIPSTKFHDGTIDAVDFDALDRFAFDGQRLVVKSGTSGVYGANGTVYETENFSNVKITSYGTHPSGANYGPAYFIVEYPDGSIAQYGNSSDSRSITDWAITYWENPQGIRISYSYIAANNNLSIEYIKYGTTSTNAPINQIKFLYKTRQRPEQAYIGGQSVIRNNILSEIQVMGSSVSFRNYVLNQDITSLGYERLTSITEKSGDGSKSYNPTVFNYDTTSNMDLFKIKDPVTINSSNVDYTNTGNISGDFDGDGKIDIILYPKTGVDAQNKYWLYTNLNGSTSNSGYEHSIGLFKEIFPVSFISWNNKLMPKQGWTVIKGGDTSTTFSTYLAEYSNSIILQDEKTYQFKNFSLDYYNTCAGIITQKSISTQKIVDPTNPNDPVHIVFQKDIPKTFLNGDFNGDGLTDVVAIESSITYPYQSGCTTYTQTYTGGQSYFVNLDRRVTDSFVKNSGYISSTNTSKFIVADFNGDGKADIYVFDTNFIKVYTLNETYQFILLYQNSTADSSIALDKPILIGDYNGDGKSDFVIPSAAGQDNWNFYFSSGIALNKLNTSIGLQYNTDQMGFYGVVGFSADTYSLNENSYIANDYNGDGKTDILYQQNLTVDRVGSNYSTQGTPQLTYLVLFENKLSTGDAISFSKVQTKVQFAGIKRQPISIFTNYDKVNQNLEYSLISNNSIRTFNATKDNRIDVLLKKVTTGNGVSESISYSPLAKEPCNYNCHPTYSDSGYVENYPNMDIITAPGFQVVSKVEKQSATTYKKQLFAYYGAVSNVEGLGFLGFRSNIRTNWYANDADIISSISKFDISQRGANTENYTVLGLQSPPTTTTTQTDRIITKEGDYAVTGTDNLIATQRITLKPNTWIKPGSTFTAKINPDANSAGGALTDFITKSILTYESDVSANKVFKIQNTISKQYNALDNTNSETTTVYDTYNNPTQSTTLLKEGGTTVQTTVANVTYDNQPTASTYYIGRPTNKTQSVTVNGDTMNSEEQYVYTNHLLTQIKKKGNNTDFITEDNAYDAFGNITKKTITATGLTPRVTNYAYDPSGRFLTKSSDIETLTTTFDYNPSSGVLNFEINPYGLKTTYEYDSWFKKTKTTDYLGKSNTYAYTRIGNVNTLVTTTGDDGSSSIELFDDLGRKTTSGVKDITGILSNVDYYYDIYDRNYKVSEPYNSGSASQFNTTEYDVYGRVIKSTSFTGKIVSISYSGLTTTVNDGSKTKTSTKNAIGKVVAMTDTPGGTINYTYFANGNLKSSNYDGVTTTIEQDGWGRKTKLTDPSAGIYSYAYNGFGETISENTPNGTTTYGLDDFGKLKTKNISGTNTNSISEYVYDGTSKLLTSSTFKDLKETTQTNYTYTYDSTKRITTTEEETPFYGTKFTKLVSYDTFGRVEYETSTAAIAGKSSAKKIKNVYKNGSPWQIIDDATQQVLWQTNTVNARGQLTGASLGNGIDITNTYDAYGFAKVFKHDKTGGSPVNVMTLTTNFDEKKGNLKDRTNSLFNNGLEVFEYDALDRLTKYPNALGQQITQDYDARGRITQNNLGTYNYDSGKPYQNKEILLTPEALGYYADREGIFNDSMEEQKDWQKPDSGVFFDKTFAHTGNTSFKISNSNTAEKVAHSDIWIPISNSVETEYTYSAWVYTDNPQAELFLFMKTAAETGYFTYVNSVTTSVKNQWVLLEGKFKVPANITKLNIRLDNNAQGNVWFDDVQIRKTSNTATAIRTLNIDYNVYKSPVRIEEKGVDIINFAYNDGNSRYAMFYGSLDALQKDRPYRKFYSADGSMEIKENRVTGVMEFVTYIGGDGYSAPVVLKSDGTTQNYLYLHRDYQGSIVAITNATGTVIEKRLFDAWGAIVKVQDGAGNTLAGLTILDRGYTGHEHLQSVGLINMNARLYDPKLHRFLQPDNYVQDPSNTQNYNRYGYCWNNPLKYTDASGEWINIVIGAAVGGVLNWATHGCQFNAQGLGYFGVGAVAGALTAMGAGGVSSALAGGSFSAGALGTTAACTAASSFASGAIIGAAGGLVGGFTTGFGNSLVGGQNIGDCFKNGIRDGGIGAITGGVVGGIVGGVDAAIDGRDFWSGKKWVEVNTGFGKTLSSSSNVNFSDPKWDVEQSMNLKHFSQGEDYTCTYRCKLSVDDYFGSTGQEINNKGWLDWANAHDGVLDNQIEGFYHISGYSTNSFSGSMTPNNGLPWIANEMRNNRVVQIGWYPDSSISMGHASLISKVKYLEDFSKYRIYLMDPAGHSTSATFKNIYQILSIWK